MNLRQLAETKKEIQRLIDEHLNSLPTERAARLRRIDKQFKETGDTPSEYMLYCLARADYLYEGK